MEEFLDQMYRRYSTVMLNRARRYAASITDAKEIAGECWVRLCRNARTLAAMTEHSRTAYVMRCVRNTALDYIKRRAREESLQLLESFADPANMESEVAMQDAVDRLLNMLTPRQRQIVRMKLDGHPVKEIAHSLDLTEAGVRTHWHRALDRMRPRLLQWERKNLLQEKTKRE